MPTYVYEIIPDKPSQEITTFEYQQGMNDKPVTVHPETGQPVRRVITSGFYLGSFNHNLSPASGRYSSSNCSIKDGGLTCKSLANPDQSLWIGLSCQPKQLSGVGAVKRFDLDFHHPRPLDHHSFGNLTQCGARSLGRLQTALKAVEPDKNIHQSLFHDHP